MPFLLSNPALLLGLLGLGAPILIHLLLRRQQQRLRFPTNRFFVHQELQTTEKRKLRNLLLLSLRLLILALLVFAFARPYLPSAAPGDDGRPRQRILVMDRTASMNATSGGTARWLQAVGAARKELAELRDSDRAALISFSASPRIDSAMAPSEAVRTVLEQLTPTSAAGELSDALREAGRLARTLVGDPETIEIVVISDFQRSSAAGLSRSPLPEGVRLRTIPIGELIAPNTAIVDLTLPENAQAPEPSVTIVHFGDEPTTTTLKWIVDAREGGSIPVRLDPAGSTNIALRLPGLDPGWHNIGVTIDSKDALAMDNSRMLTLWTPPPFRIWLAEPRPNPRSFRESTFFLAAALDPNFGITNRAAAKYSIEKVKPSDIAGRLSLATPINRPDVILLPSMASVPTGLGARLTEFVKSGGGVWFFLGDDFSETRYPIEFNELLPATFRPVETLAETNSSWRLSHFDKGHPLFSSFSGEASGGLRVVEFRTRRGLGIREPSAVLARFEDDVPILMARTVGEGRILLGNFGTDTKWSDWPKHKSFVPFIRRGVDFLAGRIDSASISSGSQWITGTENDVDLGERRANQILTLVNPSGVKTNRTVDAQGRILGWNSPVPGVYQILDSKGESVASATANVASSESDLSSVKGVEIESQIAREPNATPTTLAAGFAGDQRGRQEAWRWLLLAAFVLLLMETVMANRART